MTADRCGASFRGEENIPELESDDGHTALGTCKICTLTYSMVSLKLRHILI